MAKNPTVEYYSGASFQSEPDLRQELINTLEGAYPEVAKGKPAYLRKMRKDTSGVLIKCVCVDPTTGEPDKDDYCPFSLGERYFWDESEILVYKEESDNMDQPASKPSGLLNIPVSVFYMRYDVGITPDDKIVEMVLGTDGRALSPRRRSAVYSIRQLIEYRSDRGRLEFFKAICSREFVKFLNPPT